MKITKNFSFKELTKSATADRCNIDNSPPQKVANNLKNLTVNCLQPIRDKLDKPIIVTSGYRCTELNTLIRGSKNSQHIYGEAVDIECFQITTLEFFEFIKKSGVEYDKLILEFYTPGSPNSGWVHLSWRMNNNRNTSFSIGVNS